MRLEGWQRQLAMAASHEITFLSLMIYLFVIQHRVTEIFNVGQRSTELEGEVQEWRQVAAKAAADAQATEDGFAQERQALQVRLLTRVIPCILGI